MTTAKPSPAHAAPRNESLLKKKIALPNDQQPANGSESNIAEILSENAKLQRKLKKEREIRGRMEMTYSAEQARNSDSMKEMLHQIDKLTNTTRSQHREIGDRFHELAILATNYKQKCAEIDRNAAVLEKKNQQIAKDRATIEALKSQNRNLRTNVDERFSEISKLSLTLKEHKLELNCLLSQVEGLKAKIESQSKSLIWRITKPFRIVSDILGMKKRRQRKLILESKLFDAERYLLQNPDVAASHLDPIDHFIRFGGREGRDPSSEFSTTKYVTLYPEVHRQGFNALIHYLEYGRIEGRIAPPP